MPYSPYGKIVFFGHWSSINKNAAPPIFQRRHIHAVSIPAKVQNVAIKNIIMLLSMAVSSTAVATGDFATLYQTSGNVMVNQGEKHIFAPERFLLKPGYRVMTIRDGSARIEFDGGCTVTLGPREVYLVTGTSPCAANRHAISDTNTTANPPAGPRERNGMKLTRKLHPGR